MSDEAALYEAQLESEMEEDAENQETNEEMEWRRAYYPSNSTHQYVVNAMTGHVYPFRVGSEESQALFHVTDVTGTCDGYGLECHRGTFNREPNQLYYDSPTQYMVHRPGSEPLSNEFMAVWHSKTQPIISSRLLNESYNNKIATQYAGSVAHNEAVLLARDQDGKDKKAQRAREAEAAEAFAINRARAKVMRDAEVRVAVSASNKHKRFLCRERRRQAAAKLERRRERQAAGKLKRNTNDSNNKLSTADAPATLQRTYSVL